MEIEEITVYKKETNELVARAFDDEGVLKMIVSDDVIMDVKTKDSQSEPAKKATVKLDIDTEEITKVIQKELDRQIKSQNT